MKAAIHPTYHANATLTCACGNVIEAGSTVPQTSIELCSKCHPFYTGKQNLVDTAGRVDRFARIRSLAQDTVAGKKAKQEKRTADKVAKKAKASASTLEV